MRRIRVPLTLLGLVLCVVLGVALLRTRTELRAVAAERIRRGREGAADRAQVASLQRQLAAAAAKTTSRRQAALALARPADRARAAVGPLLLQLKADRAVHPVPHPSPAPLPPRGSFFPELLGDPEYNLAVKDVLRARYTRLCYRQLQDLGVAADGIDRIIDLLAEREMLRGDTLSLLPKAPTRGVATPEGPESSKIFTEIRDILGPERYSQFANVRNVKFMNPEALFESAPRTTPAEPDPIRRRFTELENRLSYSATPLTPEQIRTLLAYYQDRPTHWPLSDAVKSLLTPEQQTAVDNLNAERAASLKRSRLRPAGK